MTELLIVLAQIIAFVLGCLFGAWNERRRKSYGLMRRYSDRNRIDERLRSISR